MHFSAKIWRRSENIQALGDILKLTGEKSPIRRQRGNSHQTLTNPTFLWKTASVDISHHQISTCRSPMAAGEALYKIGRRPM